MDKKGKIESILVAGLFFLALGGWLLHLRLHPLVKASENIIPLISGIISVFCLPLLFCFGRTVPSAYIINGFLAILGTIIMAQFSIVNFKGPATLGNIILNSTFADIAILWGKFSVGKAIFDLEYLKPEGFREAKSDKDVAASVRFFRYPNMGWWWAHLFALALVYSLGNIFWK